jgi:hypothetical protein
LHLVAARIDDALDRRLMATIDSEHEGRVMAERHAQTIRQRQAELAVIEGRVNEARGLLAQTGEHAALAEPFDAEAEEERKQ